MRPRLAPVRAVSAAENRADTPSRTIRASPNRTSGAAMMMRILGGRCAFGDKERPNRLRVHALGHESLAEALGQHEGQATVLGLLVLGHVADQAARGERSALGLVHAGGQARGGDGALGA